MLRRYLSPSFVATSAVAATAGAFALYYYGRRRFQRSSSGDATDLPTLPEALADRIIVGETLGT